MKNAFKIQPKTGQRFWGSKNAASALLCEVISEQKVQERGFRHGKNVVIHPKNFQASPPDINDNGMLPQNRHTNPLLLFMLRMSPLNLVKQNSGQTRIFLFPPIAV